MNTDGGDISERGENKPVYILNCIMKHLRNHFDYRAFKDSIHNLIIELARVVIHTQIMF